MNFWNREKCLAVVTGLLHSSSNFCSVLKLSTSSVLISIPAHLASTYSSSGQFISSAVSVIKNAGGPNVLNIDKRSSFVLCQYAIVPLMVCMKPKHESDNSGLLDMSLRAPAVNFSSCDASSDDCLHDEQFLTRALPLDDLIRMATEIFSFSLRCSSTLTLQNKYGM